MIRHTLNWCVKKQLLSGGVTSRFLINSLVNTNSLKSQINVEKHWGELKWVKVVPIFGLGKMNRGLIQFTSLLSRKFLNCNSNLSFIN